MVVQWLGLHASNARGKGLTLVGKLRFYTLYGTVKIVLIKKSYIYMYIYALPYANITLSEI